MSRPAMRQLSTRLRHLQLTVVPRSVRHSSRYSNPSRRTVTATPPRPASFTSNEGIISESLSPAGVPRNPYDAATAAHEYAQFRAYHLRRMRFAGAGLLLSAFGLGAIIYNLDLDELDKGAKRRAHQLDGSAQSNADFQGRNVHIIGAGEDKRIVAEGEQETDLVETGTSSVPYFPRTLSLPSGDSAAQTQTVTSSSAPTSNPGNIHNEEEYTLIGLGIRTVSFLSIQVYVMGLYIRTSDISTLQARLIHHVNPSASTLVPSEKDTLKADLVDPVKSTEIWDQLLRETGVKSAWRISPTRNTDFAHLRDGWITGIKKGTQAAQAAALQNTQSTTVGGAAQESEYESEAFGAAVREFKETFTGGSSAPKGSIVLLLRDEAGRLDVLFQDPKKSQRLETIGRVQDPRIGRLIWMGYLAGKNVSSEAARRGVADGFVAMAARPVGSVETMVT